MSTTTDQPRPTAARPGWYYRQAGRWVRVDDPRQAPKGLRVWGAEEMQVLPSGELAVRPQEGPQR